MEKEKPKFNVGDVVFYIDNNKAKEAEITGIFKLFTKTSFDNRDAKFVKFEYFMGESHEVEKYQWKGEEEVFSSKEELIASL